jgi:SDR family mycofactocin-dependent oxidoreductase
MPALRINSEQAVATTSGRVANKRVLITGAARGMGRSHAVRLAEEGADLILVDICESLEGLEYPLASVEDLEETARLVGEHGRRALTKVVDVRDEAALKDAVADGAAELGGLDAAVANAGVLTAGTWDTTTNEQWRLVLDINLIGAWNTCAAALPFLLAQGGGSLVNISSAAGIKGSPLHIPYTASKQAIVGMSVALANELAAQSIRVNTVHPTGVMTGMAPVTMHTLLAETRADLAPIFGNALPTPLIEPVDVSNAVLYLVSDESRYVTGLQFKVDAGVTIR